MLDLAMVYGSMNSMWVLWSSSFYFMSLLFNPCLLPRTVPSIMWTFAFPTLCLSSILTLSLSLATKSSTSTMSSSQVGLTPMFSWRQPKSCTGNLGNIVLFSLESIWVPPYSIYPRLGGFLPCASIIHQLIFHIYRPQDLFG